MGFRRDFCTEFKMLNILDLITITCILLHSQFAFGSMFIKGSLSNKSERLDMGCLKDVGVMPKDVSGCAIKCLIEDKCESFCMDQNLKCYIHFHCNLPADSSDKVSYFQRLPTPEDCLNAGTWQPESQTCECSGGYVGLRCERFAESCKELYQLGYIPGSRQPYIIQPPGLNPFLTYCANFAKEIRTHVFYHSATGLLSFNRSYSDYVNGFYNINNNNTDFWIGLEKLYILNTAGGLSIVYLEILLNEIDYVNYKFFGLTIGNSSTNYTFNYYKVNYNDAIINNTTVSNCLPISGLPFSVYDTDNDAEQTANCAKNSGAGWWFSTCKPNPVCNPLGIPVTPQTVNTTPAHMRFKGLNLKSNSSQFQYVRMFLIEPV